MAGEVCPISSEIIDLRNEADLLKRIDATLDVNFENNKYGFSLDKRNTLTKLISILEGFETALAKRDEAIKIVCERHVLSSSGEPLPDYDSETMEKITEILGYSP